MMNGVIKMKRLTAIFLTLLIFIGMAAVASADIRPPHLQSADAALVVDMNTDTILYELNKDTFHSIASLTKIMTSLLAVEAVEQGRVNLTDLVTAQSDCLQGMDVSSSNAGITPGEVMTFEDYLYCALVHSANDACNVLGTYLEGSIGAFVNKMNERADEIGCTNTNFVDTDGMLNRTEGHYSCPYDLYLITKEAMSHPLFAKVCGTADYTVTSSNYRPAFDIHNSNALLSQNGLYGDNYLYSGVIGVKTGFTKPAGYCLVSVCQRGDSRIMVIVLGCNGPLTYTPAGEYQNFVDSTTLYDWAFTNYSNKQMFLAGEPMKRLAVEKAENNGTVALCASESLTLLLANDVTENDILTEIMPDPGALVAPITAGQEIGTVNIYVKGEKYSSVRLVADADVNVDQKIIRNEKIKEFMTSTGLKLVVILLILLLIFIVALRVMKKQRRRRQVQRRISERENARADQWVASGQNYREGERPGMTPRRQAGGAIPPRRSPAVPPTAQRSAGSISPRSIHAGAQAEQRSAAERQERRVPVQSVPRQQWVPGNEERNVHAVHQTTVQNGTPAREAGKYPAAHAQESGSAVKKSGPRIERIQRPAVEQQRVEEQRKTTYHDLSDFYK